MIAPGGFSRRMRHERHGAAAARLLRRRGDGTGDRLARLDLCRIDEGIVILAVHPPDDVAERRAGRRTGRRQGRAGTAAQHGGKGEVDPGILLEIIGLRQSHAAEPDVHETLKVASSGEIGLLRLIGRIREDRHMQTDVLHLPCL